MIIPSCSSNTNVSSPIQVNCFLSWACDRSKWTKPNTQTAYCCVKNRMMTSVNIRIRETLYTQLGFGLRRCQECAQKFFVEEFPKFTWSGLSTATNSTSVKLEESLLHECMTTNMPQEGMTLSPISFYEDTEGRTFNLYFMMWTKRTQDIQGSLWNLGTR